MVGHPLDVVKVRIQTRSCTHVSVTQMLRNTFASHGIIGIYRGLSVPLLSLTPTYAAKFWGYDVGKSFIQDGNSNELTIPQLCIAGGISAFPTTLIMAPTERIKCLLQAQANEIEKGGRAKYKGLGDCAVQVYREGGMQSILKGTNITLLRNIPMSIAWFGTYEIVTKQWMDVQNIDPNFSVGPPSPLAVLFAGGLAGMACWIVSLPVDVLKTRYQTAPIGKYNGIADVYSHLMKTEGPRALFRGIRPALIRAFPAHAACSLGVEMTRTIYLR